MADPWLQDKVDAILTAMYGDPEDNQRAMPNPYTRGSYQARDELYRPLPTSAGVGSVKPEELAYEYDHAPILRVPSWYRKQFMEVRYGTS